VDTEIHDSAASLKQAMSLRTPHLTFVDVREQGDLAIDALFDMGTLNFPGGVQLMGTGPMPVMEVVKRMGQRHSLQMLTPLKKPLDANAVRGVLNTQGIKYTPVASASVTLDEALANDWIEFWYQPKINLAKKQIAGVETFARVRHPELGTLPPSIFMQGATENDLMRLTHLALSAALERDSEHPLATAIIEGAEERGASALRPDHFESVTGKGVKGRVDGATVALGNAALMNELGVDISPLGPKADEWRAEARGVMFVAVDNALAGMLAVADPIKETAREAIRQLHEQGVRVVMLTGDSKKTADAVAKTLGIDDVRAEVLPDQKADAVRELQRQGCTVAMAGDGINDAPALAQAQVGIAMGTGTDVAMESAGVTLVRGDLRGIVRARRLSQRTMSNIRQNLFFAFIYNAAGVPLAAGVLYPSFGLLLSPMIAAAAMSLSSVSVITNALRLRAAHV
jgi:soluble P-type ATPase